MSGTALPTDKIAPIQHISQRHGRVANVPPGRCITLNRRSTGVSALQPCQEKKRKHKTHKQEKRKSRRNTAGSTEDELDVGTVIGSAQTHYARTWHQNSLSSVARYQPLQPEYVLAPYLSTVKGLKSRKLISRFRCGCHGLHVDTSRLLPLAQQVPREQRHCVFCASGAAEDEHDFVFDCPAYCAIDDIRNKFTKYFGAQPPHCLSFVLCMILKS